MQETISPSVCNFGCSGNCHTCGRLDTVVGCPHCDEEVDLTLDYNSEDTFICYRCRGQFTLVIEDGFLSRTVPVDKPEPEPMSRIGRGIFEALTEGNKLIAGRG